MFTEKTKWKMVGVPMNFGADRAGIVFGVDVLKESFPETFGSIELIDVVRQKENFNNKKLKYKNTVFNTCQELAIATNRSLNEGMKPLLIGGDHSLALGSVSGVAKEKEIGIVWIDAHGDMNTDEITESGNIHGMPLALLQGYGDRELVNCFYEGKKLESKNAVVLGARDLDVKERELMDCVGVKYYSYEDVCRLGLEKVLNEIREHIKVNNLHISFDVDSVDPSHAPGVSTPVANGFTKDEMFKVFEYLFKNFSISSVDVVEFNPANDIDGKTAEFVNEITNFVISQ